MTGGTAVSHNYFRPSPVPSNTCLHARPHGRGDHHKPGIHSAQLKRLGSPGLLAEIYADRIEPPSTRSESGGGRQSPRLRSAIRLLSDGVHPRPLASAVLILDDL